MIQTILDHFHFMNSSAHGRFVDGGLASNNPSLDLLTEIGEINANYQKCAFSMMQKED